MRKPPFITTVRRLIAFIAIIFGASTLHGNIWTAGGDPPDNADFRDPREALDSPLVADGDILIVLGRVDDYGELRLERPVHLRGEAGARFTRLEVSGTRPHGVVLTGLMIDSLVITEAGSTRVSTSLIHRAEVSRTNEAVFHGNIIDLSPIGAAQDPPRFHIERTPFVRLHNNVVYLGEEGAYVYADWMSECELSHNLFDTGSSAKVVLYSAQLDSNLIVGLAPHEFTVFEFRSIRNVSERDLSPFDSGKNLVGIPRAEIFAQDPTGWERYRVAEDSQLSAYGSGQTEVGPFGGRTPLVLPLRAEEILTDSSHHLLKPTGAHPGGWYESAWMGLYVPLGERFIYHRNHGFQFLHETHDGILLHDYFSGRWFWTTVEHYPVLRIHGARPQWVFFRESSAIPFRSFFSYDQQSDLSDDDL